MQTPPRRETGAPLKQPIDEPDDVEELVLPPVERRGPIEATVLRLRHEGMRRSPPSRDGGPIEATGTSRKPARRRWAPPRRETGAPLKLITRHNGPGRMRSPPPSRDGGPIEAPAKPVKASK